MLQECGKNRKQSLENSCTDFHKEARFWQKMKQKEFFFNEIVQIFAILKIYL